MTSNISFLKHDIPVTSHEPVYPVVVLELCDSRAAFLALPCRVVCHITPAKSTEDFTKTTTSSSVGHSVNEGMAIPYLRLSRGFATIPSVQDRQRPKAKGASPKHANLSSPQLIRTKDMLSGHEGEVKKERTRSPRRRNGGLRAQGLSAKIAQARRSYEKRS